MRIKKNKILAIDYGRKRIGIAISEEEISIALPLKTIKAKNTLEDTANHILDSIKEYLPKTKTIILGLPLLLSGETGEMAEEVQNLKTILEKNTDILIILWDERLSSSQADKLLKEKKLKRKKRTKIIDPIAATVILQSYLDFQKNLE